MTLLKFPLPSVRPSLYFPNHIPLSTSLNMNWTPAQSGTSTSTSKLFYGIPKAKMKTKNEKGFRVLVEKIIFYYIISKVNIKNLKYDE